MRRQVMCYGRFESQRSLPKVNRNIARTLSAHFDVSIWSIDSPWVFPDRLPQSEELFRVGHMAAHRTKMYEGTQGAAIELRAKKDIPATFFGYPDQIMAGWMRYHLRRYPGFVCESMDLLQQWQQEANRHTAIWVPSKFCYDVFKQARVAVPIHVIRHGVEPEFRPLGFKKTGPMTFLLLNTVGHFSFRKGILEGMRAFHDAFSHGEDVRLLLRSPADDAITGQLVALADDRIVLQEPGTPSLDAERMNWLYNKVHVYFSPSRGEGFNLCVAHGSLVTTERGVRPIETIIAGDTVLSHTGNWRTVLAVSSRRTKSLVSMTASGIPRLIVTAEHPVLVVSRRLGERAAAFATRQPPARWLEAKRIEVGDYLVLRAPECPEESKAQPLRLEPFADGPIVNDGGRFTLATSNRPNAAMTAKTCAEQIGVSLRLFRRSVQFGTRRTARHEAIAAAARAIGYFENQRLWLPKEVPLDAMFCKLIGYYAAEGSCGAGGNAFNFALHATKDEVPAKEIVDQLKRLGLSPRTRRSSDLGMVIFCSSRVVARMLTALCGRGAANKRLPAVVWSLGRIERTAMLEALIRGDGSNAPGALRFTSASATLAFQVRDLWLSLGLPASIRSHRAYSRVRGRTRTIRRHGVLQRSRRLVWTVGVMGKHYTEACRLLGFEPRRRGRTNRTGSHFIAHDAGWLVPVREARRTCGTTRTVHNLKVSVDESFVTSGVVVHNCALEARAAGIPVVMTAWHGAREHFQKDLDIEIQPAKGLCGIPISEEEIGMAYDLDHDALVGALRQAYAEYDNRSAMSLAAAPRISREWAWSRVLEPLVELLRDGTVGAARRAP